MSKRSKSTTAKADGKARRLPLQKGPTLDLLKRLGSLSGPQAVPDRKRLSGSSSGSSLPALYESSFNGAIGLRTTEAAIPLMNQILNVSCELTKDSPTETLHEQFLSMFAQVAEFQPKSPAEAMLATQMIATQMMVMKFLRHINLPGQTSEGMDVSVARATRLMRVFNEQLDMMAKLQGKTGMQKVTVEHVNVHSGGQAIVGTVTPRPGGTAGGQTPDQP